MNTWIAKILHNTTTLGSTSSSVAYVVEGKKKRTGNLGEELEGRSCDKNRDSKGDPKGQAMIELRGTRRMREGMVFSRGDTTSIWGIERKLGVG